MAHIGEVIDNSLGWDRDIWSIPGREIAAFGEWVSEWALAVTVTEGAVDDAAYYGGWPSANLATVGWDGVVSTGLLMEHQVVGKEPLSDWFSMPSRTRPRLMAARTGWVNDDGSPAMDKTRQFLAHQLPALRRIRPLLDAGIVRLVPSSAALVEHEAMVRDASKALKDSLLVDPLALAHRFDPQDLTVDDDVRGLFVMAGGGHIPQTVKYLQRAVDYFSSEYVLANVTGATYTSVFEWERHVLTQGLGAALSPHLPATDVVLQSRLPVFSGLTPDVITTLHGDDAFADFRAELAALFGNCPVSASPGEVSAYLLDRERTALQPIIDRATRQVDDGPFRRLGLGLRDIKYSLVGGFIGTGIGALSASGVGPGVAAGVGALLPVVGSAYENVKKSQPSGSQRIWGSLVRHGRTLRDEVPTARPIPTQDISSAATDHPWKIPAEPSNSVVISAGSLLGWLARDPSPSQVSGGYHLGAYAPCPCGSRLKYRFCCSGVAGTKPA